MTIRDRIILLLQEHPEGMDDDALTVALHLKQRQQANMRCRLLAQERLIIRRRVQGKLCNFWNGDNQTSSGDISSNPDMPIIASSSAEAWYWEGNVQAAVVQYLMTQGWEIHFAANTISRERGIDIRALRDEASLWITVKGYPRGTTKTRPSTQAGHWFKVAVFDIISYRGQSETVTLGIALPDFPRYRSLAQKIGWFQSVAGFSYLLGAGKR